MFITKTLKLIIVYAELVYRHLEVFYMYLILRLLSPGAAPWLELRGQDDFCVF